MTAICLALLWLFAPLRLSAQGVNTGFFNGARQVSLDLYLDSLGVAPLSGVTQGQIEQVLPPELQLDRRLSDGLWVVRRQGSLPLDQLFELAASLEGQNPTLIHQAGPLGRIGQSDPPVAVSDHFIVRFHDNVVRSQIDSINQANSVETVEENPFMAGLYLLRVTTFDPNAIDIANAYHLSPLTEWATPDLMGGSVTTATPNDPLFGEQWHLENTGQNGGTPDADIDAPDAWNVTVGSPSTVVAVIEPGGFRVDHADLVANIWENPGESGGDPMVDEDGNGLLNDVHGWDFATCLNPADPSSVDPTIMAKCGDESLSDPPTYHGTAVAGLIAARGDNNIGVTGVCQTCKLMLVRTGSRWYAKLNAFLYARDEGADVINASWAMNWYKPIATAIKSAADHGRGGKGSVVVFSVFNYGDKDECGPPDKTFAAMPEVTSVSASNNKDVRVPGTGHGNCLALLAPGATGTTDWGVTTTDDVGLPGYNTDQRDPTCPIAPLSDKSYTACFGGTSSAAPIVSGVASLVLTVNPSLTRQEVQNILNYTADKVNCPPVVYAPPCSPADPTSFNPQYGYGRVNAYAAVDSASQLPGATTNPSVVAQPATFEMGFRAGVTWLSTSAGDRTVSNAPGGGPDGEPAMYVAWIPSGFPVHWMLEAQLGLSFTSTSNPPADESNVVVAIQPAYLVNFGLSQLYAGVNAAAQTIDVSGTSSSDTAIGGAFGYRYRPVPQLALRAELRYRWWATRSMSEWGLGAALGVVF